jgi:hypothetical protein
LTATAPLIPTSLPGRRPAGGDNLDRLLGRLPVHSEIVFAAEQIVIHAGGVRLCGIDLPLH